MRITIIGCGNMGTAFAERLSDTYKVSFYDRNIEKANKLEAQGYGKAIHSIKEATKEADVIILAIKPQNFEEFRAANNAFTKDQIIISIMTGLSLSTLRQKLSATVIRMMPNLALVAGKGVIGLACDDDVTLDQKMKVEEISKELGMLYWLPETKINALTALTGSGPAFVLVMIESMVDAAIAMGFTAKDARPLVKETIGGTLSLLEKTDKLPGELKWQITSPQGTTIAGLIELEKKALRSAIIETFLATYSRANALSS